MEPESGLIFKNISSLVNLDSYTKFELAIKVLHIKLPGNGVEEKLNTIYNNIVSIKSSFLGNRVICKT